LNPLRVAVIGCGVWGRNHVRVLSDMKNVDLACISDVSEKIIHELGAKYHVPYCVDPEEIFANPMIDAVTVCTPSVTHFDLARRAIEAGKHVLVEKPMTNTVQEAEELIRLSEKHDVKLAVGFIERFNPAIRDYTDG
jgi:UDP-N-acetylglucosamine 3-dehydrogenase